MEAPAFLQVLRSDATLVGKNYVVALIMKVGDPAEPTPPDERLARFEAEVPLRRYDASVILERIGTLTGKPPEALLQLAKLDAKAKESAVRLAHFAILTANESSDSSTFDGVDLEVFGGKVFKDPIHGHIEVDPLSLKIIDTLQFQRLGFIKQLGGAYWVYRGASHNRFEHSLGVYHLAGLLLAELQKKQPNLNITLQDVLCVKIAGLCHDLGHGPFSHLFEQFMKQAKPDVGWKHEEASVKMLDYLIKENKIKLDEYGLAEQDQTFIKELINPPKPLPSGEWKYEGREPDKSFLYQIVCNEESGMDVDKWDYFARDSYFLGLPKKFDHMQLIQHARVVHVDDKLQICYRKKEWSNVYDMFYTRASLHRQAYQHKAVKAVEMMILDALLKADKTPLLEVKDGKIRMSSAVDDLAAYTNLTDQIFQQILYSNSKDPNLVQARDILQKLTTRKLYRFVGEIGPEYWDYVKGFQSNPALSLEKEIAKEDESITAEDIGVKFVKVDYGKGDKNPVKNVRFWKKDNPMKAESLKDEELSRMFPVNFADRFVRVYCKNEESFQTVKGSFDGFYTKLRSKKEEEEKKRERGELTPTERFQTQESKKPSKHRRSSASGSEGPSDKVRKKIPFDEAQSTSTTSTSLKEGSKGD